MLLRFIERIRNHGFRILGPPLLHTGGAFFQFPFILEQVIEEMVAPFGWRLRPGHFRTTRYGVATNACAVLAFPAEPLIFNRRSFWVRPHQRRITCAMGFTERM